jgi:argininosuccinate lyase
MRKGRFKKPAAEIAQRYGESVSFDWRLYRYDIAGSIAHARAGIISADELQKIQTELRIIQKEIEADKFKWDASLEDVHMNIETAPRCCNARLHAFAARPGDHVPLAELKKFSSLFDSDVAKIFDVRSALAKKRAIGAPSAENIAAQIKRRRCDLGR